MTSWIWQEKEALLLFRNRNHAPFLTNFLLLRKFAYKGSSANYQDIVSYKYLSRRCEDLGNKFNRPTKEKWVGKNLSHSLIIRLTPFLLELSKKKRELRGIAELTKNQGVTLLMCVWLPVSLKNLKFFLTAVRTSLLRAYLRPSQWAWVKKKRKQRNICLEKLPTFFKFQRIASSHFQTFSSENLPFIL